MTLSAGEGNDKIVTVGKVKNDMTITTRKANNDIILTAGK